MAAPRSLKFSNSSPPVLLAMLNRRVLAAGRAVALVAAGAQAADVDRLDDAVGAAELLEHLLDRVLRPGVAELRPSGVGAASDSARRRRRCSRHLGSAPRCVDVPGSASCRTPRRGRPRTCAPRPRAISRARSANERVRPAPLLLGAAVGVLGCGGRGLQGVERAPPPWPPGARRRRPAAWLPARLAAAWPSGEHQLAAGRRSGRPASAAPRVSIAAAICGGRG